MKFFRERFEARIPTASMADIAFLLIIFFMVTTTFRAETGLKIIIPQVEAAEKMPTKDLTHVWIAKNGLIAIDDALLTKERVSEIMSRKRQLNPNIIVSLKCDEATPYKLVEDVLNEFIDASVLRIHMAGRKKRG
ncbi:MAG: biopolymer transporter ExbD [candidate division WOR-3 bacterium]